jgi:hypothetical protein
LLGLEPDALHLRQVLKRVASLPCEERHRLFRLALVRGRACAFESYAFVSCVVCRVTECRVPCAVCRVPCAVCRMPCAVCSCV